MFDSNLTKEKALEEMGGTAAGPTLQANISPEIIALCREANALRNFCFQSEENYKTTFDRLCSVISNFQMQFAQSGVFKFLSENLRNYTNAKYLHRRYEQSLFETSVMFIEELASNSMVKNDHVPFSLAVSPKGLLIDIDEGEHAYDEGFSATMRNRAHEVLTQLQAGQSIENLIHKSREKFRTKIGYVPPGLEVMNGLPYRGNGIANVLFNNLFRINVIRDGFTHYHSIALHSSKQLHYVDRMNNGDITAVPHVYAPTGTTTDAPSPNSSVEALDEVFRRGLF